jgi:hypothetical protein
VGTNLLAGLSNIAALATGAQAYKGLAVKSDGAVVAWGDNLYGQTNLPAGLSNVLAGAVGNRHSLAIKNDGTVVGWGSNYDPESPGNPYVGQATVPSGLSNVVAIAAGANQSLGIRADLMISSLQLTGTNVLVQFHSFAGRHYGVESSTNLSTGWAALPGGNILGNGQDAFVTDTVVVSAKFYRVKLLD